MTPRPTVLFDTSVLVAAVNAGHEHHETSLKWLLRAKREEIKGVISAHTLAELYGHLTGYRKRSPVSTGMVLNRDIVPYMQVITLTGKEYIDMIDHAISMGLAGGIIFDALHAATAIKAKADHVLTLNRKDFYRAYPELTILVPEMS